ncbi:unnamed protein product [Xylocopa violacea]|uniref:C2H2-type domain-containing protein n=1 Tax=Xylocopa violacea TaxID=135666 RepID=A0ABP1NQ28_XYLVO
MRDLKNLSNTLVHVKGKFHKQSYSSADDMDTLTKRVNELLISNEDGNNVKHENDLIITDNMIKQITKYLSIPLAKKSISKNPKITENSLVKYLNQQFNKKCLEVEEEMYIVEDKLNSIKANLRFIIPLDEYNFYCLACNERILRETYLLYEHICIKSHKIKVCLIKENIKSKKLIDEYLQEVKKDMVKCFPCQSHIKNNMTSISKHTNTLLHINNCKIFTKVVDDTFNYISEDLCNLWYNIQRFCCVLCTQTFKYKIIFIKHVVKKHSTCLYKGDYVFNFCIPCTTLWLDRKDSYTEHCEDITHKYLLKSQDFMIEKLPGSIRNILMLVDDYSNLLFQKAQQILLNDNIQQEVKQSLENILKKKFPTIQAFVFGSRVTGLGLETSDIDIYLDCGNTYSQDICESLRKENFTIIKQTLYLHEKEWEITKVLEKSRTPIIKLVYKRTGIKCDISTTNGLSVENSKLIRSFIDAYPPCRKLILFIKKWYSLFNLNERQGLTSYALAWLVIFYLQSRFPEPYLPSVATLIKQNKKSRLICGWETGVAKPKNVNKPKESVSTLLMDFLKYYASFDYQHYVICPLMGQRITKTAFAELSLPMEMKLYIEYLSTSKSPEYFRIDSPLCVQDPFDLAHNLTKAVTNITLKYFKQYCQDSVSILLSSAK